MKALSRRFSPRDDEGFSLVETLVAFAILALVTTMAVQIMGSGSVRTRRAEATATALAHAQSRLAAVSARPTLSSGSREGALHDGYGWRLTISPLAGPQSAGSMTPHLVSIEVWSPEAAAVTLTTILLAVPKP